MIHQSGFQKVLLLKSVWQIHVSPEVRHNLILHSTQAVHASESELLLKNQNLRVWILLGVTFFVDSLEVKCACQNSRVQ